MRDRRRPVAIAEFRPLAWIMLFVLSCYASVISWYVH